VAARRRTPDADDDAEVETEEVVVDAETLHTLPDRDLDLAA
jgi:hypothetical protein